MQIKRATLVLSLLAAFGTNAIAQSCPGGASSFHYPLTKKVDQQDNYHGTMVADPYRTVSAPPASNLVRLHIGLEDPDDLIADLAAALKASR